MGWCCFERPRKKETKSASQEHPVASRNEPKNPPTRLPEPIPSMGSHAQQTVGDGMPKDVATHGPDESSSARISPAPLEESSSARISPGPPEESSSAPPAANTGALPFKFQELAMATNNFSPDCLIGEGGFGCVYKGRLEDGQVVAIKQLDRKGLQGNREFLVEVVMLSLLHHENLVNLIGYCADGDQRLLVYEFMPLGSLEDHLHDLSSDKEPLDWITRLKIATGAAKGLEYLHDIANPPVIYRDLKSSNILLGEGFFPRLSDFGLAKLGPVGDKTHVSTRVMGTYGYCAPEYAMTGQLTSKSDVYSFGVVLLELITGRRAIDQSRPSGEHNLVAWARPLFRDRRKFPYMADPNLKGHFPGRSLFQALAVAAMCLHEQAAARPSIADVVTALNFLASQRCDPEDPPPAVPRKDGASSRIDKSSLNEDGGDGAGVALPANNASRQQGWKAPADVKEREQAVAEARVWGEALRDKRVGAQSERDST